MSGGISLVAFVGGVLLGSLAGLLLHRFVSWLLCEIEIAEGTQDGQIDCLGKSIAQYRTLTMAACCFVAVGIIWWEVICHRLLPGNVVGPSASSPALFARPLGHILFFWFLAAAAWVDIRYRVIPDVITTPGVLCGLVALVIFPALCLRLICFCLI